LEELFAPASGFEARLWNAGHVLGSASVEIQAEGGRLLFSGDLGPDNKAFQASPAASQGFDHVVCETTYGDRSRENLSALDRRERLAAEVDRAIAAGGNLIIPTFALERTQELLFDLASLLRQCRLGNARVFVDSPLANRLTGVFNRHAAELEDIGSNGLGHEAIHMVEDTEASIRLNSVTGGIILAASGMCEGGRIRHHLVHNLPRSGSTILFVGYQAQGTLGRVILEGASRVRISGRDVSVRAAVRHIDGYSAHADQTELLAWISARAPISGSLFLNHGEQGALERLGELAAPLVEGRVLKPEIGERYELRPATPAKRTRTGLPNLRQAVGRDWQNDYAALAVSLKQRLLALPDNEARQAAIRQMRNVLEAQPERTNQVP
jgi:metallo-beta-lactamase family protein